MRRHDWAGTTALAATIGAAMLSVVLCPTRLAADASRWGASYFPNVALTTQNGETVHFYDLIKGKTVAIDLIYTTCEYNCPLETGRLAQVQELLADRMGRDLFFLSISIDPKHDTPAVLKTYADEFHAGPGWLFLTGKPNDVELLSKKLGLYSRPNRDDPDGHTPMLLIGNEATGQWVKDTALDNPRYVAQMIRTWTDSWKNAPTPKTYAEAPPIAITSRGQYLFTTKCTACHTIGRGDRIGPDLAGISSLRERGWLARYIAAPDVMRNEGDPIASALFAKYKTVRMPNLSLTEAEASDIVAYVDAQTASTHGPNPK
ncbi:MAG: electron transporter SenC [Acidobacteria bacterium]|nr:MAG: electron transporter SenC [Acidobacteriota bacterium]PYR21035.1 MAG: electron transporter SenC [Acidobacteriota bacterium]PYR53309.1 MAG: electron transporter SenC [Acidobacteriota bacterium]